MRRSALVASVSVPIAAAIGLALALTPVSAHDTDDPKHNWNRHYLPMAERSFFTKEESRTRFLQPCERGTIAFSARVRTSELTSELQDVATLNGGSAFNCTGGKIFARRDGTGSYFWVVETVGLVGQNHSDDLFMFLKAQGDRFDANVFGVGTSGDGDAIHFDATTYRFAQDETLSMEPADPAVVGLVIVRS